ncbi:MAG TPA: cupin domain-containing protein [Bryobacteraceae bacterium]|jgi:mannose-6-phosphate isomerase-like protein (cupin superfamily)|nr:cupin domain-containing protein [Bryobacteraceae bacterium]
MDHTRRDLTLVLPTLFAAVASADTNVLPSKCYAFDALAAKTNPANHMEIREVFKGRTQTGCPLALHISTLPPGQMPHPSHHHVHEELMLIKEGRLEFTIAGQTDTVGPGSAVYINSNEEHGMKNVGSVPAQYFVVEIGAGNV